MLVLFRPSPQSIVRAYVAGRVHGAKPVLDSGRKRFFFDDTLDADSVDYDSLYRTYKERFGGLDFLEDEKLFEILEDEIFWASRYSSPDRYVLIFDVLSMIERSGTKAYLNQESAEAKEMKDRIRRVTGEFRRAKEYLTFREDAANKVLVGKGSFEHDVADLVLRHFARKRPGFSVVVLDDREAHIHYEDEILVDSAERFPARPGRKDSRRYWLLLSDINHLEAMKDRRYYGGDLPKNYWKWVGEDSGEKAAGSRTTLDDFVQR
jgi:hypothetical protein